MAILLKKMGNMEGIARYSGAAPGDLVGMDNALVNAVADQIKGIVLDDVPADNPPKMLRLAGKGCIIEDTAFDGVAPGNKVWSDGDGTYSVTEPTVAAGAKKILFAYVRRIDTVAADTGAELEIVNETIEDGTV